VRNYSNIISLVKNARGIYALDTTMGCESGLKQGLNGCYNDCYAAKYAKRYGYDFSNTILREFKDEKHRQSIVNKLSRIELPFFRVGVSGDPSEDWGHTLNICEAVAECGKQIVIITKHWTLLTNEQLLRLRKLNACVNTSISALDPPELFEICLNEYETIKPYCKSILRVVSCDFNKENQEGKRLAEIQENLFNKYDVLDTILRVSKNNTLVTNGVINIKQKSFLDGKCYVSQYNKKTYFGKCEKCLEYCGINM
jgi:hypothetical protein